MSDYNWKFTNNKELINLSLTKEEAEVVSNYLLHRRIKLEDCQLKDSYCYPKITSVYYKIEKELHKPDPLKVLICACRLKHHKPCDQCPMVEDSVDCFNNATQANHDAVENILKRYN